MIERLLSMRLEVASDQDRMLARDGETDLKHQWNALGEQWQVRSNTPKLFQENRAPQYPQGCVYESSARHQLIFDVVSC